MRVSLIFIPNGLHLRKITKQKNMRKIYLKICATLFMMSGFSQIHAQSIPEILYYKFDEVGTSVTNYASAPPTGTATATIMGGVTQGSTGKCGAGALVGSGISSTTDYLNTGWAPNLGTGSWTISWWSSDFGNTASLYYIFGDLGTNSFRCFTNGVAGANNWILRGAGLTDTYINGGATAAPTMNTFVYDNALNQVRAYLNGVLVSTVAQTAPNLTGTGPLKVMGYNTTIGAPAGGKLDEFRFYNRALTDTEVLALNYSTANGTQTVSACNSYTWINGITYTSSNTTDKDTIIGGSVSGCDSVVTLNLSIYSYSGTVNSTICNYESVIVNGTTYNAANPTGTETFTGIGPAGCDSIVSVNLNVLPAVTGSVTTAICYTDSVVVNGTTYNALNPTGTEVYLNAGANGCDSIVTVSLNVLPLNTTSQVLTVCAGGSVIVGANTYNTTGVFTDVLVAVNGCDSTVTTNLTVSPAITGSQTMTVCAGDSVAVGSATYNTSGTYTDVLVASNGCDSTVTTNLTVSSAITGTQTVSVCAGGSVTVGTTTHTTTGTYTDVLLAANGCDSTVTTNLTVAAAINLSVTNSSSVLTANQTGATYQWLDCNNSNQAIAGETNQSYTASVNGSYAVEITVGNCVDTSACSTVVSINEFNTLSFSLYPNPTSGLFTMNLADASKVEITNALGQLVFEKQLNAGEQAIDLSNVVEGVYFVKVNTGKQQGVKRVVINK